MFKGMAEISTATGTGTTVSAMVVSESPTANLSHNFQDPSQEFFQTSQR